MSEQRDILQDSVTRLFGDLVTRDLLEQSETGTWPESLWQALEENGLALALVPEDRGGGGASWSDAYVIVKAAGRQAAPVPLPETILAGWLLSRTGLDIPEGPTGIAAAHPQDSLHLERSGGAWRLSGTLVAVPWGRHIRHVAALARAEGGSRLVLAATGDAAVEQDFNIAREPRDTLHFDAVPAAVGSLVEGDPIRLHGAMLRAAQIAGAVETALSESVGYAQDRVQFGRPIAKFQAIQHQLAHLAARAAQAGIAADRAFRATDRGAPFFEIACAKIVAGEAAGIAAATAHQVHGAIGFTYEHALHHTTRRLWSWRAEFGAESSWALELGRNVAARGADALWPELTQRQSRPSALREWDSESK